MRQCIGAAPRGKKASGRAARRGARYTPGVMLQIPVALASFLHALPFPQDPPTGDGGADPAGGGGGGPSWLLPMVLVGAIFWFVLIRPERQQRKRREVLLAALEKGDKVMTNGGLYGTVAQVQGDVVTLQVADGVRLRFTRQAIQGKVVEEKAKDKSKGADVEGAGAKG